MIAAATSQWLARSVSLAVAVVFAAARAALIRVPPPTSGGAGTHEAGAAAVDDAPFAIRLVVAAYGRLMVAARPSATCRARAVLPSGGLVLAADFLADQVAEGDGQVLWLYRTPVAGAGSGAGHYEVTCVGTDRWIDARAAFDVP
jgi:hypothetical protein